MEALALPGLYMMCGLETRGTKFQLVLELQLN